MSDKICPNCNKKMSYWWTTLEGNLIFKCKDGCGIPLIVTYTEDKKELDEFLLNYKTYGLTWSSS